ncbi:MAG: ATP synthase F1 subunit gamma [Bryobacterales bacterium]|nr:ATP synthase F1 subunit gamma [Bryobacterales bacterium]MDE0293229.1 ATP synthase F1 subunit gamma [Bryobacterales bacterium]
MPNLIDLRRRIRSVKNTQQITSAMKMVSAAKLRRAQDRVIAARPYASLMRDMLGSILVQLPEDSSVFEHELLQRREEKRIAILLISADKGLCGAFNSNVVRFATRFLSENPDKEITLQCVGRRGRDFFHRKRVSITREWVNLFARPIEFSQAKQIAADLMQSFRENETDVIYLLHNEFKSALAQTVVFRRLLPIQPAEGDKSAAVDYIYEQPPETLFETLLPRYIEINVYQGMIESAAAEHAARMTAMDAATRNAGEVIDKLTLHLNRVRQASITKELIEVVSGAEAL